MGKIMDDNQGESSGGAEHGWADVVIRLALAAIIVYWSFLLLQPFIPILIWAAILSVALHPIYLWLNGVLGGRSTPTSFLLTVLALVVILGPVSALGSALVSNIKGIAAGILEGTITVPPPPPFVADLPLIGDKLSAIWQSASVELGETLASLEPELKKAAGKLLGIVGNVGVGVLQFMVAIIIAGFTYGRAAGIQKILKTIAARAAPRMGEGFVDLAGGTVRSVTRGVVGISLIQSILFGVGALVAEIPLAGVWAFAVLIFAIVQIGPMVVIVPVIIYAWVTMDTVGAAILTAYMVPVSLLDNVLKPIVMGRGLPVPMLVIFIGVIGGTLAHGLIGVFVGPIVLAVGYELARAWITRGRPSSQP
jgi:predicted PurR-regulated permease PerM